MVDPLDEFLAIMRNRPRRLARGNSSVNTPGTSLARTGEREKARENEAVEINEDPASAVTEYADIAILTALRDPEGRRVLQVFGEGTLEGREGVLYRVIDTDLGGGRSVRIVSASQSDMGMVLAAILATKTIRAWRPQLVIMTGVCAGDPAKTELGDIVVAKQVFDYGSGKLQEGRLIPDFTPIVCENGLVACLEDFATDLQTMQSIKDGFQHESWKTPPTELKVRVGPMASGAAVVASDDTVTEIQQHKRSLIAMDMEAYGVARAVHDAFAERVRFIIVKGVQDFADSTKADDYREYAAYVSARFVKLFLEKHWNDLID